MNLLSLLRVHSVVVGLDISDEIIRLAYFNGSVWQMHAIRLPPGTMEAGKLKDRATFLSAINELRTQSNIAGHNKAKKVAVVVALSSASAYSKVFRLPILQGADLEKAIALNLEMASPSDASQVYASSQVVGRDENTSQLDVLASFMDRSLVDDVVDALFAANFVAMAVEPKSLALTRVFREKGSGIDITKSYVLVSIDNGGMEFFIVRNGVPYFEYVNHWRDIANEKGELPLPVFEDDLKASLRQVLNFYAQHWSEPLAAIILSNASFPDEVEKTIASNFAFPAVRLTLLMGQPISAEWLVALGSSLRGGGMQGSLTKEVNFLSIAFEDRFRVEQMVRFLEFWRAVFPASLIVLVAAFLVVNATLNNTRAVVESEPGFTLVSTQSQGLTQLQASTTEFNESVGIISSLETTMVPSAAIVGDISGLANTNGIAISRLTFSGAAGAPVNLSATAASEDKITTFKAALTADPKITSVNLPLTGIQALPTGNYSFSVSFVYHP